MNADNRYRHRCVADLAWAVASPPLLRFNGGDCNWFEDQWYQDAFRQIESQLLELDNDPHRLESLLAAQRDQRLGNYFETLWCFALELNPRYQLIERNLQIIDGQRTLGEMDFIVHDRVTGRTAHWELAVKFYLGIGDTVKHQAWHGPGRKDRLDLKVDHLIGRQILLGTHPVTRATLERRGIVIEDCAVILKGRLFYPWRQYRPEYYPASANPTHLAGLWLTRSQAAHHFGADSRLVPLIRSGWMASTGAGDAVTHSFGELLRLVDDGLYRLPMHVMRQAGTCGSERYFIVGDNWATPENTTKLQEISIQSV